MMDRIIVVVMMIASAECTGKSGSATTMYERHPRLDDLVFQHHLILESSARSRVECGIKCHKSQSCAAFTYSPSSDTCRQHSCISTSPSPSNHSSGAETWLPTLSAEPRNLALGKPTRQSTNMNSIQVSDNAVDGDLNNVYLSCTTTGYGDFTPYWLVDLEKTVEVHAVIITNRWDCCADRLKDFDVEIFAQDPVANPTAEAALCYHYTGPMARGATETLNCSMAYCGRYVRIRKSSEFLTLCEVQVLGK